jgi:hypothetical protein
MLEWILVMSLRSSFGQQKRAAPMGSALAESIDVALESAHTPHSEGSIHNTGTDRGLHGRGVTQPAHRAGGQIHVELVWSACRHCINLGGYEYLQAQGNRTCGLLQANLVNFL